MMSYLTDSFQGSLTDCFVQSKVDQRDAYRIIVPPITALIGLIAYVFESRTQAPALPDSSPITWENWWYCGTPSGAFGYLTGPRLDVPPWQGESEVGQAIWEFDVAAFEQQRDWYVNHTDGGAVSLGAVRPRFWYAAGGYQSVYPIAPYGGIGTPGSPVPHYAEQPFDEPPIDALQRCTRLVMESTDVEWNAAWILSEQGWDNGTVLGAPLYYYDPAYTGATWPAWVTSTFPEHRDFGWYNPGDARFDQAAGLWMDKDSAYLHKRWMYWMARLLHTMIFQLNPPPLPDFVGWVP